MNAKDIANKHGMLSPDEIDLLQHCVYEYLPAVPVVVNIGANVGTSACAILGANPLAFIFSIDVKPYPEEKENIIACGLDPKRVVRLLGDSADLGTFFPYRPDLVFVDGAHDDKGVIGDIEAWKDKCKSVMLYHDFAHPNYREKPNVHLDEIVTEAMKDWKVVGQARYLIAFKRTGV